MLVGICDDNIVYLKFLLDLVGRYFAFSGKTEIEALNPDDMAKRLENKKFPYDIIITDIDMGSFNGIEFAKKINEINPTCSIIFISNYINYAMDVYDTQHVYFVIKSEAESRIPKALDKAVSVYHNLNQNYLMIKYQNKEYRIPMIDITYIEALGRYLYIYDRMQSYKCINSLKVIASELSDTFVRCHNSYIVNLNYIRSISRTNCTLASGTEIPISQTYLKCFQAAYVSHVSNQIT